MEKSRHAAGQEKLAEAVGVVVQVEQQSASDRQQNDSSMGVDRLSP